MTGRERAALIAISATSALEAAFQLLSASHDATVSICFEANGHEVSLSSDMDEMEIMSALAKHVDTIFPQYALKGGAS
jgi:hypothetical protein